MKLLKVFELNLIFCFVYGFDPGLVNRCFELMTNRRLGRPNPNMLGTLNLDNPREIAATMNLNIPFTRHHIIPYNVLFTFFRRLLLNQGTTTFVERMNEYVELIWDFVFDINNQNQLVVSQPPPEIAAELARNNIIYRVLQNAPQTVLGIRNYLRINNQELNIRQVSSMVQSFFLWLPGNILIGPTHRSDDPRDGFEIRAFHITGMRNYRVLDTLYHNLVSFNNLPANSPLENLYLNQILTGFQTVMRRTYAYPYNPNQWRQTGVNMQGQPVYEINILFTAEDDNNDVNFIADNTGSIYNNHHLTKRSTENQLLKPPTLSTSLQAYDVNSTETNHFSVALTYQFCFDIIFNYAGEAVEKGGFSMLDKLKRDEL